MFNQKNNIALIDDYGKKITYQKLRKYTKMISKLFMYRDIIILKNNNSIEFVLFYLAALRKNCVVLLVSENCDESIIERYCVLYNINYYINISNNINYSNDNDYFNELLHCVKLKNKKRIKCNNELILLLPTSGSTGSNKLVRISKNNLKSNTKSICKYLNIKSSDIAVTSLPINYTYGLSIINTHLYKNATVYVTKHLPYTKEFWDKVCEYKVTTFSGVPYIYEMLMKLNKEIMKIESIKTFTVAGGKMNPREERFYSDCAIKYKKNLIIMYGQTEATARISYRPKEKLLEKKQSAGIAIPGGKVWIEDENGIIQDIPYTIGEIVYEGDNVSMGYAFCKEDLLKGYEWGNILHTKDKGYIDQDGYIYVLGRMDRVVKLNGNRIDLNELEKILRKKYYGYEFKCNIEKCFDKYISKRIKIEFKIKSKIREYSVEDIRNYIKNRINISGKFFQIIKVSD